MFEFSKTNYTGAQIDGGEVLGYFRDSATAWVAIYAAEGAIKASPDKRPTKFALQLAAARAIVSAKRSGRLA